MKQPSTFVYVNDVKYIDRKFQAALLLYRWLDFFLSGRMEMVYYCPSHNSEFHFLFFV